MTAQKHIDKTILFLCLLGLVCSISNAACADTTEYILGAIGVLYCIPYLWIILYCPIKRDWILAKGRFLIKVVNFVLLVPFIITASFRFTNELDITNLESRNLFYDESLYPGNNATDTICGTIKHSATSTDNTGNILNNDNCDSLYLYVDNSAHESISGQQEELSLFWAVYIHFFDPGNQHMAMSEKDRQKAAMIAILGFLLLNGLLISTLINWFDRRREQWINGEIRYNRLAFMFKKVAVVIGANESTATIIKKLLNGEGEKPVDYVILLTNENVESVRENISSYLEHNEENKVIIYNGQLDSSEEIYELQISRATEIYVLGENSVDDVSQSYHDTQNMRCVHNIASYLTDKCIKRKIICRVLFEYQTTYSVFQFSDLPKNIREHLIFIPFNVYENWAQRVLVKGEYTETVKRITPSLHEQKNTWINKLLPKKNNNKELRAIEYTPLDGNGISKDSKNHVHLVVVGMSKMGVAMAIQAAQITHYPNFTLGKKDEKGKEIRKPSLLRTRITFIDENADNEKDFFMGRFQNLFALSRYRYVDASGEKYDSGKSWVDAMTLEDSEYKMHGENFVDIEWEFIKGSVQAPAVREYLKEAASQASSSIEDRSLLTIAICHPLAHEAIASALYMPGEVYDNALQILVYQKEVSDIVYNLSSKDEVYKHKRYAKLRPFGMQYADFTMDKENYYRSILCNYVYEMMFDDNIDTKDIPDILCSMDIANKEEKHMSRARNIWKKLPIFNKWSNRYLANNFETKLRCIEAAYADIETNYAIIRSRFDEDWMEMAECEHNRWNVQQLLMGFRAFKDKELKEFYTLRANAGTNPEAQKEFKEFKGKMKSSPEKVHLNICSNTLLHDIDKKAESYDWIFNNAIPAILMCVEKHKKNKNNT